MWPLCCLLDSPALTIIFGVYVITCMHNMDKEDIMLNEEINLCCVLDCGRSDK